ncbi:MAG: ABC transporter permease [Planctomycetes bacterium]|nr:ABC transporter permease [Planctomycetota bacterium]
MSVASRVGEDIILRRSTSIAGKRSVLTKFAWVVALCVVFVAVLAPLLAWHQPIVCKYQGTYDFPAVVDTVRQIPVLGSYLEKSKPFRFPTFDARKTLDPDSFAIWPPIPFGPIELMADANLSSSRAHWLGTDDRGRDVLARLIHGTRVSVRVGLYSMLLAGAIGIVVGAVAGFFGGMCDWVCSRFIEIVMCFPAFFLILAVMAWIGEGLTGVILVIGFTQWTSIARLVRAEVVRGREADFVMAARSYGASNTHILIRHLLPGALGPAVVAMTFGVADAILLEAGLSWVGVWRSVADAFVGLDAA